MKKFGIPFLLAILLHPYCSSINNWKPRIEMASESILDIDQFNENIITDFLLKREIKYFDLDKKQAKQKFYAFNLDLYLIEAKTRNTLNKMNFKDIKSYKNPNLTAYFAFFDLTQSVKPKSFLLPFGAVLSGLFVLLLLPLAFHYIYKIGGAFPVEWIRSAFRLTPVSVKIPPNIKSILEIRVPKKITKGETSEITLEIFKCTWLQDSEFSESTIKRIYPTSTHTAFNIRLESPSFQIAPKDSYQIERKYKFPVTCSWLVEPKSSGKKKIMIFLDKQLIEFLGENSTLINPIIIPIEVVSEIGLPAKVFIWIKIVAAVFGFLFAIPILSPLFKFLGEKIIQLF